MSQTMLVDAHTHFFSRTFFELLADASPQSGPREALLARVVEEAGIDLPDADLERHLARWLDSFDRHGVDHAVTFASHPGEAKAVATALELAPERLSGYLMVDPSQDDAPERVEEALDTLGFRGLLLFPALHHVRPGAPQAADVMRIAERYQAIVVVHCGILRIRLRDLLDLPRPYDLEYATPLVVIPAAHAYPGIRFVIPHFGAGFLRECLMAGAQCDNVHVDTSSSNSWLATQAPALGLEEVFRLAVDVFGSSRILFGTDSSTFPRGWRHDLHDRQRAIVKRLGLSADEEAGIFGGNIARLLGLQEDGDPG